MQWLHGSMPVGTGERVHAQSVFSASDTDLLVPLLMLIVFVFGDFPGPLQEHGNLDEECSLRGGRTKSQAVTADGVMPAGGNAVLASGGETDFEGRFVIGRLGVRAGAVPMERAPWSLFPLGGSGISAADAAAPESHGFIFLAALGAGKFKEAAVVAPPVLRTHSPQPQPPSPLPNSLLRRRRRPKGPAAPHRRYGAHDGDVRSGKQAELRGQRWRQHQMRLRLGIQGKPQHGGTPAPGKDAGWLGCCSHVHRRHLPPTWPRRWPAAPAVGWT